MSDEEDFDPLRISRCTETLTRVDRPPPRVIALSSARTTAALFSEDSPRKRSLSLKAISKRNHETFELEMPSLPYSAMPSSPSWTSVRIIDIVLDRVSEEQLHLFDRFITRETVWGASGRSAKAIFATRKQLFVRAVEAVDRLFNEYKLALNRCVLDRADEERKIDGVISRLQALTRRGLRSQRSRAAILIALHRTQMKIFREQSRDMKRDMEAIVGFRDFLGTISENTDEPYPLVDFVRFKRSLGKPSSRIGQLERRLACLRVHKKDLVASKPGSGDWEFNILHPKTKSGKVIQRFEERIEFLRYEEVFSVIDHLCQERSDFRRIESLLFDLAWSKKPYPFGFCGKRTMSTGQWALPVKGDMFPAVIGSTVLSTEFAFTPFSLLNGTKWPFRSVVDKIFEMMILTNPFDIARVCWNVIQDAAKCLQRVLVIGGVNPEDVEIDFDSLFPVLMICVFAFGMDEWMRVAMYAISFADQAGDDPELQFAMTYLEGLVTHIIALDQDNLKRKATEMRSAWADSQSDPLGLA
jgi:hypothetical protein